MEVFKGGMGLVFCVDCGQKVSNEVPSCPHCGRPAPLDADAIQALREKFERRELEKRDVERKAVQNVSVAGSNLRYACPIAGIVLVALGYAVVLANYLFEFSHIFYQGEGVRAGALLFWFLFANCTFFLGLALPVLACQCSGLSPQSGMTNESLSADQTVRRQHYFLAAVRRRITGEIT